MQPMETRDLTAGDKRCHCVKSRCLKLYCDCFARGAYCSGCACVDCQNTEEHAQLVSTKRAGIREKNPEAFQSSARGCNCRRSQCLKMYCECYKHGVACAVTCKCQDCLNTVDGLMHRSRKPGPSLSDRSMPPAPSVERLSQPLSCVGVAALAEAAALAAQSQDLDVAVAPAAPLATARSLGDAVPASTAAHAAPDQPRAAPQATPGALPLHESVLMDAPQGSAPSWCAAPVPVKKEDAVVPALPGTKRPLGSPERPHWGVCKARTTVRPPSATRSAQAATGLIGFAADNSPMNCAARYQPLTASESALHSKPLPGDKTWLFGGAGQPSLRQVHNSDPWPYAPAGSLHARSMTSSEQQATVNSSAWPSSSDPPSRQQSVPYEGQPPVVDASGAHRLDAAVPLLEAVTREWEMQGPPPARDQMNASTSEPSHASLLPTSISPLRRPIASPRGIQLFTSPERPQGKPTDAAALATPAAHHLIFAPRESGGHDKPANGERILSASELLPLPTTSSKAEANKRGASTMPSTWFKTPVKGMPASPFPSAEESPSERSTIPQLYTPEINAVLDLDVSIKWRLPSDGGMSPLPAVTPLVTSAEPAPSKDAGAGLRGGPPDAGAAGRASEQLQRKPSLRSHRTLDFSDAQGRASLAQPAPVSTAWHLNDGNSSQNNNSLASGAAAASRPAETAARPTSAATPSPFMGLTPHSQPSGSNKETLFKQLKPQNDQVLQAWQYIHARVNGD